MTWNSGCSIASDDENSRHSFLSDCDSEFDLRPPPRYPAEKRTYSGSNKQLINRIEPPLTRSRAKATGKSLITSEPLPKPRRHSALRRSVDAFTSMASTLTNSLNNNSILFPKQEASIPLDGVNILADRFESCSLDEGKLNRNCLWPSRETNSHYTRPVITPSFGSSPFFIQPSTSSTLFGQQQQAQLWSRFRYAASTLRNDQWLEQTDFNLFTFNQSSSSSSSPPPPQTVPMKLMTLQNQTPSSTCIQRKNTPGINDPLPSIITTTNNEDLATRSSSKIFFTLTIFVIGVILGCLLTNTIPLGRIWEICLHYFHIIFKRLAQ